MEPQQAESSTLVSKPVTNRIVDKQGDLQGSSKELWLGVKLARPLTRGLRPGLLRPGPTWLISSLSMVWPDLA